MARSRAHTGDAGGTGDAGRPSDRPSDRGTGSGRTRDAARPSGPPAGAVRSTLVFVLLGVAIALLGPTNRLVLVFILAVWAIVVAAKVGTQAVVTASMMAVAATAPMNGVRAYRALAATDVLLLIAVVGLVAEAIVAKRRRPQLPTAFWAGVTLVVLGGCLGTFFATHPLSSLLNLLRFSAAAVGPVLVLRAWAPGVATLRRYCWCWAAGASASGLLGLFSPGDASGRSAGLSTHPNHLAMISALGSGLALALAVSEKGWRRWVASAMYAVLTLTVVRAGSRAGLLALAVTAAIVILRARGVRPAPAWWGKLVLSFIGLGLLAVGLLSTGVIELGQHNAVKRFLGDATSASSNQGRLPLLEAGFRRIGEHPLTGSGFENVLQAHNIYVQVWAGAGLVGVAGFLVLAWSVVRTGLAVRPADRRRLLATAFVAGYVGYLVAGTVQNFLWDRYLWLHVAVILWVGTAAAAEETHPAQQCA